LQVVGCWLKEWMRLADILLAAFFFVDHLASSLQLQLTTEN
jgi:hypothetical protein